MRNSIVLQRIQSQTPQAPSAVQMAYDAIQAVTLSPPIAIDELRMMLMSAFGETAVASVEHASPEAIHFENIYDFTAWYDGNQEGFTSQQRLALDTIKQTRALIEMGCACKRASREAMAHQYFDRFWLNNKKTDLLASIAKITGAKKVTVGSSCIYPIAPEMPR